MNDTSLLIPARSSALIRPRFYGLDAIRGIAAVFVATLHIPFLAMNLRLPESILAVDLFFCLSGVVLADAYGKELADGMKWRTYMLLRLVRLYPFYMLSIGFSLIFAVLRLRADDATIVLLLAIFLVPCGGPSSFPLNGPTWSLCDEIIASVAYGIAAKLKSNTVFYSILPVSGVALLLYCNITGKETLDFGSDVSTFAGGLLRMTYSFVAGVTLRSVYGKVQQKSWNISYGNATTVVILLFISCVFSFRPGNDWRLIYEMTIVLFVFPCVLFTALWCHPSGAVVSFATLSGAFSYPLYILHEPLAKIAEVIMSGNSPKMILSLQYIPLWFGLLFLVFIIFFSVAANATLCNPIRVALDALRASSR